MIIAPSDKKYFSGKTTIKYNGKLLDLQAPRVMGILNVTPDSFYDGGRYHSVEAAVSHAALMIEQGVSIIDVGACSTRPGAKLPDEEEEMRRLSPIISALRLQFPELIISIDTFRSKVAAEMVKSFGDCIINDISAGTFDPQMFETIARLNVPYVLTHIKGTPDNMHKNPHYENVTKEVIRFLSEKVYHLHSLGVSDVIIDPGFGFAKNLDHNYELFNHLDAFRFLELPLLVGISRKSMIYKLLNKSADDSLHGTIILNTLALQAGANMLRVHDVSAAMEAVTIFNKLKEFAK